jgi:dinuclear metal center YbgI/SA1388 family protein
MASRKRIAEFLDSYLDKPKINDTSCNGLQVQGAEEVQKIGLAVDASIAAYRKAAGAGCRMLIVHHGLIWTGIRHVTGKYHQHIKFLMDHEMSLYASHLPLDKHSDVGNNARLARILKLSKTSPAFDYHGVLIGIRGMLKTPLTIEEITGRLTAVIGGNPMILPFGKKKNRSVGIVSGGGAGELEQAIDLGLDCYITGESAHHNHHQAAEAGINVIYAGHYHTEMAGVKAVGKLLEKKFKVQTVFLDVPTLV